MAVRKVLGGGRYVSASLAELPHYQELYFFFLSFLPSFGIKTWL